MMQRQPRLYGRWVISHYPTMHDAPWEAWNDGKRLRADTLAGLKQLCRIEGID